MTSQNRLSPGIFSEKQIPGSVYKCHRFDIYDADLPIVYVEKTREGLGIGLVCVRHMYVLLAILKTWPFLKVTLDSERRTITVDN